MLNARFLGPHGSLQSAIQLPYTESQQIPETQELSIQALSSRQPSSYILATDRDGPGGRNVVGSEFQFR
jgi:hypothetical protein